MDLNPPSPKGKVQPTQNQNLSPQTNFNPNPIVQNEKYTPEWLVILLFLTLPPFAIYMVIREKHYHDWLPFLLWLFAVPAFVTYFLMKILVVPQLATLYKELNVPNSIPIINFAIIIFLIYLLSQTIFGVIIFKVNKAKGFLSNRFLILTILFFSIDFLASGFLSIYLTISLISPIYNLTSYMNESTVSNTTLVSPTPTQTIDPTADWKTYMNQELGISFKYPQDGTIQDTTDQTKKIYVNNTSTKPYYLFSLEVKINLEKLTARQFIDKDLTTLRNSNSPGSVSVADKRQTTIKDYQNGEVNGIYMRGGSDGDSVTDFIEIVIVHKDNIYVFTIHDGDGSINQPQKTLMDQILSTFKFIDQTGNTNERKACQTDSDCKSDEFCTTVGPIAINPTTGVTMNNKYCWKKGAAVPL